MKRFTKIAMSVVLPTVFISACEPDDDVVADVVRPVKAETLQDAAVFEQIWFSGRAAATQEVDLSFRVGGSLIARPATVGDAVDAGAIVAQLDPATFDADVERIRAELAQANAEERRARADLRRNRVLAEQGHIAQAALDKFISAANGATAAVDARAAALRSAELDRSYTQLAAPFAGDVVETYVEAFQDIQPNQPIVRIVDKSRIEMTIDVPESMISLADQVDAVDVQFDPFPDLTLTAEIKEIGAEATDTTRTYPVTLIMDQPDGATILPGMAGRASAREDPRAAALRGAVTVPETAVFGETGGQETFVWVVEGDAAEAAVAKRRVELLELTARGYVVSSGVTVGETIVVAGVNFLKDGQKVRLSED